MANIADLQDLVRDLETQLPSWPGENARASVRILRQAIQENSGWSGEVDRRARFVEDRSAPGTEFRRILQETFLVGLPPDTRMAPAQGGERENLVEGTSHRSRLVARLHRHRGIAQSEGHCITTRRELLDLLATLEAWEEIGERPPQADELHAVAQAIADEAYGLKADGFRFWGDLAGGDMAGVEDSVKGEILDALHSSWTEAIAEQDDSGPAPVAVSPSGSVKLFGPDDPPMVNGRPQKPMTPAQYNVILALLQAASERRTLSKERLNRRSGHREARKVLRRLARGNKDWESVIRFPARPGDGYGIC